MTDQIETVRVCKPRRRDGEWSVAVMVNGKRCEARTYYAADRKDAEDTYAAMVAEAGARV